jgi:hypothetical protein
VIAVTIGLEDALATIYMLDVRRQLRVVQIATMLAERDRVVAMQADAPARQDVELYELRRRLARLEARHK